MEKRDVISTGELVARLALRIALIIAIVLAFVFLWKPFLYFFMPFFLAYIISAILLMPIVRKLSGKLESRRKFWSVVIVIIMMCVVLGVVGMIIYYVIVQITDIVKDWQTYRDLAEKILNSISEFIAKRTKYEHEDIMSWFVNQGKEGLDWAKRTLPKMAPDLIENITYYVPTIGSFFLGAFFFVMATYFTCVDYPNIQENLGKLIPRGIRPHVKQIKEAANSAAFGYLRAQALISGIVGLIALVVFIIYGQNYALLFALLVGIIDFVPMLGSGLVLTPWSILLFISGDIKKAIIYFGLSVVLMIFRRIVEPRIVGDQTGLHPLVSLIALYAGVRIGGIIGMIFAPIVVMIFVSLMRANFFAPMHNDVRLLTARILSYSKFDTILDVGRGGDAPVFREDENVQEEESENTEADEEIK